MNVRVAGARVLAAVLTQKGSLNTLLPEYNTLVAQRDRPLLQEICFGTLRWYPRLALVLETLLAKPLARKDTDIQALLASALYQITEMRIPSHAAVNEAVGATRELGKPWARGLINGVLRHFLREQSSIHKTLASNPVYTSALPEWLLGQISKAWPDQVQEIIAASNSRAPMTLRVNRRLTTPEQYLIELAAAGIPALRTGLSPAGVQLLAPVAVEKIPGFAEGLVSVQDESAQLAAGLLDLMPGQRVLDACSAPGGKTGHILESQPDIGHLLALDIDPERLSRVGANLDRLHLQAELTVADAQDLHNWWDGIPFDRILVDAPCSGTGVIRRHPDIKVLRRSQDIAKLGVAQLRLLEQLWTTLKPGGKMLYATCSIMPTENQAVVADFCSTHADCTLLPMSVSWGTEAGPGRQLLPTVDAQDGFFYTLLQKQTLL